MEIEKKDIFVDIKNIIELSRKKVVNSINIDFYLVYRKRQTLSDEFRFLHSNRNEQIFASRYMTILPSKEDLKRIVESEVR